jgi:hypothetical protein
MRRLARRYIDTYCPGRNIFQEKYSDIFTIPKDNAKGNNLPLKEIGLILHNFLLCQSQISTNNKKIKKWRIISLARMPDEEYCDLVICNNCQWAASLLRGSAGYNVCLVCSNTTLDTIPVSDYEE